MTTAEPMQAPITRRSLTETQHRVLCDLFDLYPFGILKRASKAGSFMIRTEETVPPVGAEVRVHPATVRTLLQRGLLLALNSGRKYCLSDAAIQYICYVMKGEGTKP